MDWIIVDNGLVYIWYWLEQEIWNVIVLQEVMIYYKLKCLYFDIVFCNWFGELFWEFRMAFLFKMDNVEVFYEVFFGWVWVGKDEIKMAGECYMLFCKDVYLCVIIDWIVVIDIEILVMLSFFVVVVDWVDFIG